MKTSFGQFARYFVLIVSVLGIMVLLRGLYIQLAPMDSLGEASDNCARGDLPSVPNGIGTVATAHSTSCDYFMIHGDETTFVYLHRLGEKDSAKSLLFRFYDSSSNDADPHMEWADSSNLRISVPAVLVVTKQVTSMNGVKISYSIGKEEMSREEPARLRMHDATILFACLVLLTAICVLTGRSLLRKRVSRQISLPGVSDFAGN
jgi:hypothetical protein